MDGGTPPVPVLAERVPVDFAGEGSGTGELSWGMWEIWGAIAHQRSSLPIGGRAPVPAGTTVADLAEELRYLMSRFPSMRTRLDFDEAGRPSQRLFASGSTVLEVYDVEDAGDADPDELAAAVEQRYRDVEFDYSEEWPVRMGVVRRHGRPTHQVSVMCHLVTDAAGGAVMLHEVRNRVTEPVTGMQQLEQAHWQDSPAGQRQNERVLRHWEGILRSIQPRRMPDSTDPRSPRHWTGRFRSPALSAALPVVAARTGVDSATVLLTVFAVALNRITGVNPVVFRPVSNNRFRPGLANVVCMVAQAGICALDVEGASFDEVVERTRRGTMSAYKYAYFHPSRLYELIDRVCEERGEEIDLSCFFNDRTTNGRSDQVVEPGERSFEWAPPSDDPVDRLHVSVDDAPGGPLIEIRVDTHFFSPGDAEALAFGMEAVAVEAARDPAAVR